MAGSNPIKHYYSVRASVCVFSPKPRNTVIIGSAAACLRVGKCLQSHSLGLLRIKGDRRPQSEASQIGVRKAAQNLSLSCTRFEFSLVLLFVIFPQNKESATGFVAIGLICTPPKSRTRLSDFTFTFHFHALEKEMATHSSVLAWRIPGRGSLMGCHLWGRIESDTTEVI